MLLYKVLKVGEHMKSHSKKQVCLQAEGVNKVYNNHPRSMLTAFEKHQPRARSGVVDFKKIVARALQFLQTMNYELLFNYITEVLPTERIKSEFFA